MKLVVLADGMEGVHRDCGGVQIVVEQPGQRGVVVLGGVVGGGEVGGVGPQQVVEGEPAGDVLGEQVRSGQLAKCFSRLVQGYVGQMSGGRQGDIGAGVQPEEPEHPCGRGAQV